MNDDIRVKRADLIQQLVDDYGYTKKAAIKVVDDFTDAILRNLEAGNTVTLRNFGCFDILRREARSCPHPINGDRVVIPAHYIPRFYPSNRMRLVVKKWEDNVKRGLA